MSTTLTQTINALSLSGAALRVAPLESSGKLAPFPRTQLTPAIGVQFEKELSLRAVLALPTVERDALLKDLAIEVALHGVAFFKAQDDLTPEHLAELGLLLGELAGKPKDSTLHIHPTQELGENGLPIGQITNKVDKEGRAISFPSLESQLASGGWHTDVAFEPRPSMYTLLRMHTLPPSGGDTLWSSSYSIYDALSPPFAKFLEGLTATHDGERFRIQSQLNGYKLRVLPRGSPLNVGDGFKATHPLIRTNPVTGLKVVYVSKTFTTRINELSHDESAAVLSYLFTLQHQSHDAQVRYKWSPNDVAIWDNRSATHSATFDADPSFPRAGDRVVVVGETPYFDPESTGRKEWRARQKA